MPIFTSRNPTLRGQDRIPGICYKEEVRVRTSAIRLRLLGISSRMERGTRFLVSIAVIHNLVHNFPNPEYVSLYSTTSGNSMEQNLLHSSIFMSITGIGRKSMATITCVGFRHFVNTGGSK